MLSVLVTHHSPENRKYLDLCLKSIQSQNFKHDELEIIVISSYLVEGISDIAKVIVTGPTHYAPKINIGAKEAKGDKLLITQDDVVFGHKCIENMWLTLGENRAIVNPMSNCTNMHHYQTQLYYPLGLQDGKQVVRLLDMPMDLSDFEGYTDDLMRYQPVSHKIAIMTDWNALFCTILHKDVFDKLNGLDEEYINSHEDSDFCYRAKEIDVKTFITFDAFALHFGGRTTSNNVNPHLDANRDKFFKRHGLKL